MTYLLAFLLLVFAVVAVLLNEGKHLARREKWEEMRRQAENGYYDPSSCEVVSLYSRSSSRKRDRCA